MNANHDLVKLCIRLFERPLGTTRVLLHLESRGGHTTGIRSLTGCVKDTGAAQLINGLGSSGHVRALRDHLHAVMNQGLDTFKAKLVLGSARKSNVTGNLPNRAF